MNGAKTVVGAWFTKPVGNRSYRTNQAKSILYPSGLPNLVTVAISVF
uniref:Uncharacterized protein n=1 Tax=Arundo donax TaxID=35708 RepID=A0A0A9AIL3_ARUDO